MQNQVETFLKPKAKSKSQSNPKGKGEFGLWAVTKILCLVPLDYESGLLFMTTLLRIGPNGPDLDLSLTRRIRVKFTNKTMY